jgi:hypothetical protein
MHYTALQLAKLSSGGQERDEKSGGSRCAGWRGKICGVEGEGVQSAIG